MLKWLKDKFSDENSKSKEDPSFDENFKKNDDIKDRDEKNVESIDPLLKDKETNELEKIEETDEIDIKDKESIFSRLKSGLTKSRVEMQNKLNEVLGFYVKIDDEMLEDLEEVLISTDMGMPTTIDVIDELRERIKNEKILDPQKVKPLMREVIRDIMEEKNLNHKLNVDPLPAVILVVGVNGVGKTTTIGKLSFQLKQEGKSVLIAAGDTFRAAAIDQLKTWGNRADVDVISHSEGSDPAAVIYDGIQAAKARRTDVLICDTAGRLHNKSNLMNELEKISRIIQRDYPEATLETLLVLDATTGQNALIQAKTFKEIANITGIAITKLDGTAKGGVVVALQKELEIPIKLIGVGEGINDLQEFQSIEFVQALFEA